MEKKSKSHQVNAGFQYPSATDQIDWLPGLSLTGRGNVQRGFAWLWKPVAFIGDEIVNGTPVNVTVYILGLKNVLIFTEFL